MRRALPALLSLSLLGGCAGYAADYWRSESRIIEQQLTRYGFDQAQAQCAGRRLAETLGVWQLRQLERVAKLVPATQFGREALRPADLAAVAAHVQDRQVGPLVAPIVAECAPPPPPTAAEAEGEADAAPPPGPLWLNLGAAPTGQSIAVNASSIVEEQGYRQAWFRLTDPGASGPGAGSYLLRIHCADRTMNSMAFRRHAPDGAVVEERDFRPAGEGATAVAGGTVMEIAYLALCT